MVIFLYVALSLCSILFFLPGLFLVGLVGLIHAIIINQGKKQETPRQKEYPVPASRESHPARPRLSSRIA